MSRMKLIVLGLMAAFALSAVASSTALAAANEFKVEGKTIEKGSKVEVTGQGLILGQLEGTVTSSNIHIGCNNAYGPAGTENSLEAEGKSNLKAEFTGCTLYVVPATGTNKGLPENVPGCKIQTGGKLGLIVTEAKGELNPVPEIGLITYMGSQGATEKLSTFEITEAAGGSPKCPLGSLSIEVKGKQTCAIPSYGFESTIGGLICDGSGSNKLEMGKAGGSSFSNAKIYEALGVSATKGQKLGVN
jgi:hypothetical protein